MFCQLNRCVNPFPGFDGAVGDEGLLKLPMNEFHALAIALPSPSNGLPPLEPATSPVPPLSSVPGPEGWHSNFPSQSPNGSVALSVRPCT